MNNCVLKAKIIRKPELRYTQDSQLATTQMLVEFRTTNPSEPPATLRVVSWGNLATEINGKYKEGDNVILTGRLAMNLIDRPEGFKEKRAELVVSHIYEADGTTTLTTPTSTPTTSENNNVVSINDYKQSPAPAESEPVGVVDEPSLEMENDIDNIPF